MKFNPNFAQILAFSLLTNIQTKIYLFLGKVKTMQDLQKKANYKFIFKLMVKYVQKNIGQHQQDKFVTIYRCIFSFSCKLLIISTKLSFFQPFRGNPGEFYEKAKLKTIIIISVKNYPLTNYKKKKSLHLNVLCKPTESMKAL